jgi:actin-related protein
MTMTNFKKSFSILGLYMANQAALALMGTGRQHGLVVNIGHGAAHTVPVYQGHSSYSFFKTHSLDCFFIGHGVPKDTLQLDIGGGDINNLLINLIKERGDDYASYPLTNEDAQYIKEQFCRVKGRNEIIPEGSSIIHQHNLPSGRSHRLGNEQYRLFEILFEPNKIGLTSG